MTTILKKSHQVVNSISNEADRLRKLGLVSFSMPGFELKNGKKKCMYPIWSKIHMDNCTEHVKNTDNFLCIKTGPISGICVVDIDNKPTQRDENGKLIINGVTVWNKLIEKHGDIQTWIAKSVDHSPR